VKIQSLNYRDATGWQAHLPSELDSDHTLVLAFASPDCPSTDRALAQLRQSLPKARLIGCSTAGEIQDGLLLDGTVSAVVVMFERSRLISSQAQLGRAEDSFGTGRLLGQQLQDPQLSAVLTFTDGLGINGSQFVDGLNQGLGRTVPVFGGLAGDGSRFGETWVIDGPEQHRGHICAVGICGEYVQFGAATGGGWSDFGPQRRITRASGQVLYELDGQPALALYKTYLGDMAAGLPGTALHFPLRVRRDEHDADPLVRTILGVDEARQSMTFAGDIPEGGIAQLMRANHARLIDSAGEATAAAARLAGIDRDQACLALSVSCVGRRMVLGEHTEDELESVLANLGGESHHIGFYSYGEIAPGLGVDSCLHNQTLAVSVLGESTA